MNITKHLTQKTVTYGYEFTEEDMDFLEDADLFDELVERINDNVWYVEAYFARTVDEKHEFLKELRRHQNPWLWIEIESALDTQERHDQIKQVIEACIAEEKELDNE